MKPRPRRRRLDLREDLWRIAGVLGALLLVNLGVYLFLNLPRLRALAAIREGRNQVRTGLRAAEQRVATMRDLIRRYDEEAARLEEFFEERLGRQEERQIRIQKALREHAQQYRIDPNSIDYSPEPVEKSDLLKFGMSLPLEGGYPNLRHLIHRIETSAEVFVVVESVELSSAKEGGAMLGLTIRLSTYFRALRREAPAAGSPS